MVTRMLGNPPNMYFRLCWLVFSPLLVLCILISSIVQYTPARYGKTYTYPGWAEVVGWGISLVSIIWIPVGAAQELWRGEGSLWQRLKTATTPTVDLDPISQEKEKTDYSGSEALFLTSM